MNSKKDIVLVVDNSYRYHKHDIDKRLDLILSKNKPPEERRILFQKDNEIIRIGKGLTNKI